VAQERKTALNLGCPTSEEQGGKKGFGKKDQEKKWKKSPSVLKKRGGEPKGAGTHYVGEHISACNQEKKTLLRALRKVKKQKGRRKVRCGGETISEGLEGVAWCERIKREKKKTLPKARHEI